jgi:membrane protease YdiL (CAAX protease family)
MNFSLKTSKRKDVLMNISEIINQPDIRSAIAAIVILLVGLLSLGRWLLKTSFGSKALAASPPRRNSMHPYMPFIPLFIWFGSISVAASLTVALLPSLPDWQMAFISNIILCIGALIGIAVTIFLVRMTFARKLKGFGLSIKTIPKDFLAAAANLISAWPLVMLALVLTITFGKLLWGKDFHLEPHEELKLMETYVQPPLRALILVTTIIVAPVFEEMLFRGLFQTMIRSILTGPWISIMVCSGVFAVVHANPSHWLALFALSLCLGYSYEKSGSLFRPIFIHALFNAFAVISVLYQ